MTDITVAPPGGAPTAAPSSPASSTVSPNEAVVDQNPVNPPPPVGSQAPDKPDAERRRESIQKAFDKAVKQQEAGEARKPPPSRSTATPKAAEAKAAEAKPGHNQPPEQTPPEKAAQPRGERGQFAPREQSEKGNLNTPLSVAGTDGQPVQPARQLPEHAPYRDPPARVSELARKDWADTPESVRGDVHRMHQEFARAHAYYKGSHEAFQPIQRFHQMAQEHGTTLEKALTSYTGMEAKLREDVVAGLDTIVNNLRLTTPDGQPIGLRDISYHVLSQSPEQLRQVQQGNQQTAAAQQIGALHQEIQGLKQAVQQWQTAQQFTYTRSAVDQFADSHPRFDELGELINSELRLGFDLETAYRRAELLRPATQAAQTRDTPAQTRTDRSISGAPSGGPPSGHADRTPRKNGPAPTRRESIQRAINRVQGTSH